jgi:hypothetical protein
MLAGRLLVVAEEIVPRRKVQSADSHGAFLLLILIKIAPEPRRNALGATGQTAVRPGTPSNLNQQAERLAPRS